MKKQRIRKLARLACSALAACALAACIAGCSNASTTATSTDTSTADTETTTAETETGTTSADTSITITDMSGYELTLSESPTNMITAWPAGLAMVLMFGQGDNMAAYMSSVSSASYSWMQRVAPAILTKPQADDLTAEQALELGADLVITRTGSEAEPYRNAGLNAIGMQQSNMDELREAITTFGVLFGMEDHAQAYLDYMDTTLDDIASRVSTLSEDDYPVIYTINAGRGKTPTVTDAGDTVSTVYFNLAGGKNAMEGLNFSGYGVEISAEELLEVNPDIIVVNGARSQQVYADLMADETLSQLDAVTSGQVYIVPNGIHTWSGTGPECILYIQWLAKTLHPDLFTDVDMHKVIQDFYSTFYFTDFTDEEVNAMEAGFPSLEAWQQATSTAAAA